MREYRLRAAIAVDCLDEISQPFPAATSLASGTLMD